MKKRKKEWRRNLGKSILLSLIILGVYSVNQYRTMVNLEAQTLVSPIPVDSPTPTPDERVTKLEEFLKSYHSPLAEEAEIFIEVADQNGLDWTLLPAISGAESTFGQNTPSCAPYNPFGWRSSTSPCGWWRFKSFEESIRIVGERLANLRYYSQWRKSGTLIELAYKYCGSNPEEWAKKVVYFMEEISAGN